MLLDICKRYNDLGWAVQGQMREIVLDGDDVSEKNPSAVVMIRKFLERILEQCTEEDDELCEEVSD